MAGPNCEARTDWKVSLGPSIDSVLDRSLDLRTEKGRVCSVDSAIHEPV